MDAPESLKSAIRDSVKGFFAGTRTVYERIVGRGSRWFWRDTPCMFVLSTGRTGTKTLARLLDLSSAIDAYHEPHPQLLEERKVARFRVRSESARFTDIFVRSRGRSLLQARRERQLYAETSARMTFFAPVIAELMPRAKFLFIYRDPHEVVRSGMRRGWYVDHPADYARIEPVEGEDYYERWQSWGPFEKICWYWHAYNTFALDFREEIGSERLLSIDAADLFEGSAVADIYSFLSVPAPSNRRIEGVLEKKLNAQTSTYFPDKSNWSENMYVTLHRIGGETMRRLGYSLVDPSDGSSVRSDIHRNPLS